MEEVSKEDVTKTESCQKVKQYLFNDINYYVIGTLADEVKFDLLSLFIC